MVSFYSNDELIAITRELTETLKHSRTVDWQKKDSARAKMRMLIKKLLKKHEYPPDGMDDAVQTVMTQCELWTDNQDLSNIREIYYYSEQRGSELLKVAEAPVEYGKADKSIGE